MLLILWVFFAIASAIIAGTKNRSALAWFFIGALFPLISLIIISVLPSVKENVEFQEPDKKKRLKRIIAREGLLLIAIIFYGLLFSYVGACLVQGTTHIYLIAPKNYVPPPSHPVLGFIGIIVEYIGLILLFFILPFYPLYLLIRFIIWAVKH